MIRSFFNDLLTNKFSFLLLQIGFFLLISLSVFGQKKIYRDKIDQGVAVFKDGDIKEASKQFNALIRIYSTDPEIMYWYARCFEEVDEKQRAADLYIKAYKYNKKAYPDLVYKVGKAYQIKSDFKQALTFFKQYKGSLTPDRIKSLESTMNWEHLRVDKMIEECTNAIQMLPKPSRHKITNLGKGINSPYEDYTPLITADNSKLFFTSRRPGGMSNLKDTDNGFFEDIWYSKKDKKGNWSKPMNIGAPVNSESHDACIALSPDGKQLFLYRTSGGGDIYSSSFADGKWSKPESIGKKINSKYKEPSMSISSDNNTIYFSSDRPGGFGGLDIYSSKKDGKGNWTDPVNMGSVINSNFEDDSPYISYDGKTFYFSSNGHNNVGGFDIFRSVFDDKTKSWSKPINMGFPINSSDDDIFFVIAADKKSAYYSSAKKGGLGEEDILTIDIDTTYSDASKTKNAVATTKTKGPADAGMAFYTGKVTDESGSPLECIIHVKKTNTDEKAVDLKTKPDGTFQIPLAKGNMYGVNMEKTGFLFFSQNIDLTKSLSSIQLTENFKLIKPKEGQKIVLKNIFYQSGKAYLTKGSYHEINILYDFLSKNQSIKIEISGHTDNRGSKDVNKQISTARAKTVYDVLIKKGITSDRLKYAGYGSEKPIASNDTEDGKKKNRRTEFEITGI